LAQNAVARLPPREAGEVRATRGYGEETGSEPFAEIRARPQGVDTRSTQQSPSPQEYSAHGALQFVSE